MMKSDSGNKDEDNGKHVTLPQKQITDEMKT